jgi:hypothetical protein
MSFRHYAFPTFSLVFMKRGIAVLMLVHRHARWVSTTTCGSVMIGRAATRILAAKSRHAAEDGYPDASRNQAEDAGKLDASCPTLMTCPAL